MIPRRKEPIITNAPRHESDWFRRNLDWIALIALCFSVGAVIFFFSIGSARAQRSAEGEFSSITPPPGAVAIRPAFISSMRAGFVANEYRTDLSYEGLRRYYDSELANHGWRFVREEAAIYGHIGDRDKTGKLAFYSKENYTALLRYAGPRERVQGYTYSFAVEWSWLDPELILRRFLKGV